MDALVCVSDFELAARQKLPTAFWDFFASGADDERALKRNVAAFSRLLIIPRMLRNVSKVETVTTLLDGTFQLDFPIGIAPTSCHRLADGHDGEIATAQAAASTRTLLICSASSTTSLEAIAESAPTGVRWFQLFVYKDRQATVQLVRRAESAGYTAIVVTVDTPVLGIRRAIARTAFVLPSPLRFANFDEHDEKSTMNEPNVGGTSGFQSYADNTFDKSFGWTDIKWLTTVTRLPIIVKGVLTPNDALMAHKYGAKAVIVSNHGGRQLDSVPSTVSPIDIIFCVSRLQIEVLPAIANVLRGLCDVYMDGGVRTGADVFKALCLGAKAVFVGRPIIYGLAVQGKAGVCKVLNILQSEFVNTMTLSGYSSIAQLTRDVIVHESSYSKL